MCWSILRAAQQHGHTVTVVSLLDTSSTSLFHQWREVQTQNIRAAGANLVVVSYVRDDLVHRMWQERERFHTWVAKIRRTISTPIEAYFPWAFLRGEVEAVLRRIVPDAIFCFHFDALSSFYGTQIAPVVLVAGDLWFDPPYYQWRLMPSSMRKFFIDGPRQWLSIYTGRKLMVDMMRTCTRYGCVAAHYAAWFRKHTSLKDTAYFPIPTPDPVGPHWQSARLEAQRNAPRSKMKLLFVGNLGSTSGGWGVRFLAHSVFPKLERMVDVASLEIHHIGAGIDQLDAPLRAALDRSYIRCRGYVEDIGHEFLTGDIVLEPTPIPLGIRSRLVTAFAYGSCAVVHRSDVKGIPEIHDGVNALVAHDGVSFASAIIRALRDVSLRERIGAGARKTFEEYFSEERAGSRLVRLIETAALAPICM